MEAVSLRASHPRGHCAAVLLASVAVSVLPFSGTALGAESPPAETSGLAHAAKSAVLVEAATGKVLFAKNPHTRLPIASVTKVAALLLIAEAVERGQVRLSDPVRTSEKAAGMGGSQIFLEPGERMTLSDMLKGIAIGSANDATVAVAEHLAGTEEGFVHMMNTRARKLGLSDTRFVNSNGLPAQGHYSSAYDIAMISRELVRHETPMRYTRLYSDHLRKQSARPFWLVNTNKLVRFYPGMDGIKTGFTSEAGFCLAASAQRDNLRLIAVVLGEPSSAVRNREVSEMMNYGFSRYGAKVVYAKGRPAALVRVARGQPQTVGAAPLRTVVLPYNKMDGRPLAQTSVRLRRLSAPVRRFAPAGEVVLLEGGKPVGSTTLYTLSASEKASWWEMFGRSLHSVLMLGSHRGTK